MSIFTAVTGWDFVTLFYTSTYNLWSCTYEAVTDDKFYTHDDLYTGWAKLSDTTLHFCL